ncbi:hypothetical protein QVA66_10640 [Staphylococcus chromogenes]|nr:hypothetical protein [Staphylococcus chromogenes]
MEYLDDLILSTAVGTSAALRKPVNRLAVLAAGVGAVAYINSTDDDPNNDPAIIVDRVKQRIGDLGDPAGPQSDFPAGDPGSPAQTWALIGGAVLACWGVARVEKRLFSSPVARCIEGIAAGAATYQLCRNAR